MSLSNSLPMSIIIQNQSSATSHLLLRIHNQYGNVMYACEYLMEDGGGMARRGCDYHSKRSMEENGRSRKAIVSVSFVNYAFC